MLSPDYLAEAPEAITVLWSQAEADIIASMAERLKARFDFTPATEWQYYKLREMGLIHNEIVTRLARALRITKPELQKLMAETAERSLATDNTIYERAGLEPGPLSSSPAMQQILYSSYLNTAGLFENLTRTTAKTGTRQFEVALDRAYMQTKTGAFSHTQAVEIAIKDLASKGVAAITYPSGHTDYVEVAARRAVLTGINQASLKLSMARIEEMGAELIEVSAHAGARVGVGVGNHSEWQGKIYRLNPLTSSAHSSKLKSFQNGNSGVEDFTIGRSVGAKAANYDIEDLTTGEIYKFVEGTKIQNSEVFAGYKYATPLHESTTSRLNEQFEIDSQKWQHAKGFGSLIIKEPTVESYHKSDIKKAEVHWFQEESIGKVKFKVKRWIDES